MPEDPGIYQQHVLPLKLSYEGKHQDASDFAEFFNDKGFLVRGRTEDGTDIYFWTFMYQQRGPEVLIDGDVNQSLFVATKYSDDEKKFMHDTPFVNKGQNIEDYGKVGDIKITENSEEVKWSTGDRTYICTPPIWKIQGDHAGVDTDITLNKISEGFFHLGPFEKIDPKRAVGGYIAHGRTEGTIKVNGKVHKFKGFAVHERIIQSGIVPDRTEYMGGRGLNWIHSWSDEFSFWCFTGDAAPDQIIGMVVIDGEIIPIDGTNGGTEEAEYWHDPKSRIMTPYKWRVWMNTPKGKLIATVWGYGRAYYTWIRKHGTMVVNQIVADSRSKFTYTDGRVLEAPSQIAVIEHMRTLYRQPENSNIV